MLGRAPAPARNIMTVLRVIYAAGELGKPTRKPRGLIHPDSLELVTKGRNNVIEMGDHEISMSRTLRLLYM
jgi:hypothetical protein